MWNIQFDDKGHQVNIIILIDINLTYVGAYSISNTLNVLYLNSKTFTTYLFGFFLFKPVAIYNWLVAFHKKYYTKGQMVNKLIGYEPAGLTVHPPPRMIEGRFIFFVWVSSVTKIFSSKKVDFVGDIHIETHQNVVLRHNHLNPISTKLT